MIIVLPGIGLALLLAGAVTARHWIKRHGFWVLVWRWHSGHALDGQHRTNATWLKRSHGPRPVLHNSGSAIWWHHMPRLHRAGIRAGAEIAVLAALCGLLMARTLTVTLLAAAAAAGALGGLAQAVHRVRTWTHERHYVKPLERTLISVLPAAPLSIAVERDGDAVKSVEIEWAPETEIKALDQEAVLQAVTTRLPIEAPDPEWRLKGRERSVKYTQSEPVRSYVPWDGDFAAAAMKAAFNELVFGIGKRDAIVAAKYSQSPHLMIPGDSGGGKSNLAAVLLLQEMLRGSLIFNLDPKWISHLWLQNLPNVINAHETADLHLALCWLGKELLRRTKAAYYSAGGTGRVRGNVGSRIIVLCEELNYGMPGLKDHWREIREKDQPKQSPAITALSALACAGRASDMHEWLIAQLMTVDSTGVKDSTIRTNAGIKAMARWNGPGWAMAVGKHIPMPPPSTIPGRIQLVTGDSTRETQVPYLHLDDTDEAVAETAVKWARALAVSGTVAQIPSGPEGVPPQLWPSSVLITERRAIEAGHGHKDNGTGTALVTVTLPEAYATAMFGGHEYEAVRKRLQRSKIKPAVTGGPGVAHKYYLKDLQALAEEMNRR